ncbi:MAG: hypothetical protein FWD77_00985 [Betaproteobacteria bacterium]|nr:hypothetical protein [Betaproteobacteria bacterium]
MNTMLIWGYDDRMQKLSPAGSHYCSACQGERSFSHFLAYRRNHLWFLFSFVTDRHYYRLCDDCHEGFELEPRIVEPELPAHPIPFYTRHSWIALAALILLAVLWSLRDSPPPASSNPPNPSSPDRTAIST